MEPTTELRYVGYNVCNEKGQVVYANLPLSVAEEVIESEKEQGHFLYTTIILNNSHPRRLLP